MGGFFAIWAAGECFLVNWFAEGRKGSLRGGRRQGGLVFSELGTSICFCLKGLKRVIVKTVD